jgi:hypothetical protein
MELIVMRLKDMNVVHPKQDNSRVCSGCGKPVGIYPSGQAMLRRYPDTEIVCVVCSASRPEAEIVALAPDALEESAESVPAKPIE